MNRLILQTTTRFMMPLLLLFSVYLLLRGHNEPGGGFIGGLVGASAFALFALAFDVPAARRALWIDGRSLFGAGLLLVLAVAAWPLLWGKPLLAHRHFWIDFYIHGHDKVSFGTPLIFDLGVYLVVLGVTLTIIFPLAEE